MAGAAPVKAGGLSSQDVADIKRRVAVSRQDVAIDTLDKLPYEVDYISITEADMDSGYPTDGTASQRSLVMKFTVPAGENYELFARNEQHYFLADLMSGTGSTTNLSGRQADIEVHKAKNRGMKFRVWNGLTTELNNSLNFRQYSRPLTYQGGGRLTPGNEIHLYISNGATAATTFDSAGSTFAMRVKLLTELRR